jgi:hypothetical protein
VAVFDGDGRLEIAHLFALPGSRYQLQIHDISGSLEYASPPMAQFGYEVAVVDVDANGTADYVLRGPALPSFTTNFAVFGMDGTYAVLDSLLVPSIGGMIEADWFYAQLEPDAPLELVVTTHSASTGEGRVKLHLFGIGGFASDVVPGGTSGDTAPFAEALDLDLNGLAELYVTFGSQLFMYASDAAVLAVAGAPRPPRALTTQAPRPNPATGEATLRFTLEHESDATLRILDAAGRRVRALHLGRLGAGDHEARWDGRGEDHGPLPPGVYWLEVEGAGTRAARRVVRLR